MRNPFCKDKVYICQTLCLGSFYWHIGSDGRVAKIEPRDRCGSSQIAPESTFNNQLADQRKHYVGMVFDAKNPPMSIIWNYTEYKENDMRTYIVKTYNSGTHLVRVKNDIVVSAERMSDDSIKHCNSFHWNPFKAGDNFSALTAPGTWRGDTWKITKCDPCCPDASPRQSKTDSRWDLSVTIKGNVHTVNRAMRAIMDLDGGNVVKSYDQKDNQAVAVIEWRRRS